MDTDLIRILCWSSDFSSFVCDGIASLGGLFLVCKEFQALDCDGTWRFFIDAHFKVTMTNPPVFPPSLCMRARVAFMMDFDGREWILY